MAERAPGRPLPARGETSVNAAAHIYHRIHYAWVFEEGASVSGAPFLWIPLAHAPSKIGRLRMTPRRYVDSVGPLQMIRRAGKPPLLAATLGLSRGKARKQHPGCITLSAAKKGKQGDGRNRVIRSVPMFIGISSVRIQKKFRISQIIARAASRLGDLYAKHLRVDD